MIFYFFFHLELTSAKKNLTRLSCLFSRCPTLTPCVRLLNYTSVVMAAITEDTHEEKASFVFFYYIKIQKSERKFSYGTKRWKWYGDMNMTLLSYSHRLSTGVALGSRLWPRSLCVVFYFFLQKAADGDCILAGMLYSVVYRPGFTLQVEEMRDPRSKKSSWMVMGSPDSSGKWQKSNTNIIHKALVQHHTVWVNCSQKS